jgi:hypothetical protein
MNVTVTLWSIETVLARHQTIARSQEEKQSLARHLAAHDPETLAWFKAIGEAFGPAEVVGYSDDSRQPKLNSWVEGD